MPRQITDEDLELLDELGVNTAPDQADAALCQRTADHRRL